MEHIYAPWRSSYVKNSDSQKKEAGDNTRDNNCPFCSAVQAQNDAQYFIIARYNHVALILNLYPYNPGHLMIIPYDHVSSIGHLSTEAQNELISKIDYCTTVFQNRMKAQGVNVGINIGEVAGTSIPTHLHVHIVPRWFGDTNFMPVIAQTKVISLNLTEVYADLVEYFKKNN